MTEHRIISREEWGADPRKRGDLSTVPEPWAEIVAHTEAGPVRSAASLTHEIAVVKGIERYHTNPEPAGRGWQAIAYSFLISPSGRIFEGRGWGYKGAHTEGRNSSASGWCFLGHGDKQPLTDAAIAAAQWLKAEGIRLGHIKANPRIGTHAEYSTKGKTCPGVLVVPQLDALRRATTTAWSPPTFPGIIRPGDANDRVQQWAVLLSTIGYRGFNVVGPGGRMYGTGKVHATRRFQKRHKLTVDGIVGPATWAKAVERLIAKRKAAGKPT